MSDKAFIGSKVSELELHTQPDKISRVTLIIDNDTQFSAGDDTGRTIEKTVPWANQAMAETILAKIKNYDYKPYTATDALINPAVEIGDGVTINGIYSILAQKNTAFGALSTSEISAPGSDEIEDEYPYKTKTERQANREQARIYSRITKSAEEIRLAVEETDGRVSELKVTLDGVTIADENGETLIKGSSIDTSSIAANSITADKLNLTESISFGDLDQSTQDAIQQAGDAAASVEEKIESWTYGGSTYINGQMIYSNSIYADQIHLGGELTVYSTSEGTQIGGYLGYITGSTNAGMTTGIGVMNSTSTGQVIATSAGAKIAYGDSTAVYVTPTQCAMQTRYRLVWGNNANLFCEDADYAYVGSTTNRWRSIYLQVDPDVSSDRARKNSISYDYNKFEALFDQLKPATYKLNIEERKNKNNYYTGFIADDVEEALKTVGINNNEFSALVINKDKDGNVDRSLRYSEFIPLCVHEIQKLKSRVAVLEGENDK